MEGQLENEALKHKFIAGGLFDMSDLSCRSPQASLILLVAVRRKGRFFFIYIYFLTNTSQAGQKPSIAVIWFYVLPSGCLYFVWFSKSIFLRIQMQHLTPKQIFSEYMVRPDSLIFCKMSSIWMSALAASFRKGQHHCGKLLKLILCRKELFLLNLATPEQGIVVRGLQLRVVREIHCRYESFAKTSVSPAALRKQYMMIGILILFFVLRAIVSSVPMESRRAKILRWLLQPSLHLSVQYC